MKAIVQHAYGSPDVLHLEEVATPVAGPGEVLVRVHAASVNYADWTIMRGEPLAVRLAFGLRRPRSAVRGRDVAGRVEAVGPNVSRLRVGDDVYGEIETGSFAEYARVPEAFLSLKPASITFEQAAAVPIAATTALQGLRDHGGVQAGQRVLINGASGGVGTFAVQIAKAFGCEVSAVCGARNVEAARSLGADHVIDYAEEDFTRSDERYDVILDLAGNHTLADLRGALTPRGTLVLSSGRGGRWLGPVGRNLRASLASPFVGQTLRSFLARRSPADQDLLGELIDSGRITPVIEAGYPLADAPLALRRFEEAHARAKIVITV